MRRLMLCVVLIFFASIAQAQERLQIIRYGRGSADCVAWNPVDNDVLAVSGQTEIWIYDSNLQDIASLEIASELSCMQWSPDGHFLKFSDTQNNVIHAYRFQDRQLTEVLTEMPDKQKIEWLPDFQLMLVTTPDGIHVLDSETFFSQLIIAYTDTYVIADSGQQAAFIYGEQIKIYTFADLQTIRTLSAPEGEFTQAVWSPDETKLATDSAGRLDVYDLATGAITFTKTLKIPNDWMTEIPSNTATLREPIGIMRWNIDNRTLAVVNSHPVLNGFDILRVWNTTSDRLIIEKGLGSRCSTLSWSPNGALLLLRAVGGSGYPSSTVYDAQTWQVLETELNDGSWKLSPEQNSYLTGTFRSNEIRLLNANTLETVKQFDTVSHRPSDWDWSPDSSKFVSVHGDEVQVWDIVTGIRSAQRTDYFVSNVSGSLVWHPDGYHIMAVNNSLASRHTYNQASLRIWDLKNNTVDLNLSELTDPISWSTKELAWGVDGKQFILASGSAIRMIDQSGHVTTTYLQAEDEFSSIASDVSWNPANHEIAILQQSVDGPTILLIDDQDGHTIQTMPIDEAQTTTWRLNSRDLFVASNKQWYLLNTDTHEIPQAIIPVDGIRPAFYWSPDGSYLAAMRYQDITVWHVSDDGATITPVYEKELSAINQFSLAWHPSSKVFALATNYDLRIIDLMGTTTDSIPVPQKDDYGGIYTLAWNPEGDALAFFASYQPYLYVVPVDTDFSN